MTTRHSQGTSLMRDSRPGELTMKMRRTSVPLRIFFFWIIATCLLPNPFWRAEARAFEPDRSIHRGLWATPIEKPGLPNFHMVTQELYRGAQPTAQGMQELKKMGIKTVINLRFFHSDRDALGDTGLRYERIAMTSFYSEEKDIIRFLQIVADPDRTPVFVHCQHGADRTGLLCAIYRIVICKWTKEEAIQEMTEGGFGFHGFWTNLVRFIKDLDIYSLQRKVDPRYGEEGWRKAKQACWQTIPGGGFPLPFGLQTGNSRDEGSGFFPVSWPAGGR